MPGVCCPTPLHWSKTRCSMGSSCGQRTDFWGSFTDSGHFPRAKPGLLTLPVVLLCSSAGLEGAGDLALQVRKQH